MLTNSTMVPDVLLLYAECLNKLGRTAEAYPFDVGFTNFVVGKHELLQIPQQDIDLNPILKQNPNW